VGLTQEKRAEAEEDYAKLKEKAYSGSATQEDVEKFMGFASTYLEQSQADLKSSGAYQAIYGSVIADMDGLSGKTFTTTSGGGGGVGGYSGSSAWLGAILGGGPSLEAINKQFEEMAQWIEAQTAAVNQDKEMILNIDWSGLEGDAGTVIQMLSDVVAKHGWDSEVSILFVSEMAKNFTGKIEDYAEMLGFLVTEQGWESQAVITFISDMNWWEGVTVEEQMAALNFIGTEAGWESEATLSFVAKLKDSGMDWDYLRENLKSYGVTDETVLKAIEGMYSGNMTLADAKMMLEKSGIPESSKILVEAMVQTQVQTWMDPVFYEFASTTKLMDATLADLGATMRQSLMGQYSEYSLADGFLLLYTPLAAIQANTAALNAGLGYASYAMGGIASGPESGYTATLHGTELVVSPKASYPATVIGGGESDPEIKELLKELVAAVRENKGDVSIDLKLSEKSLTQHIESVTVNKALRGATNRRIYN
jgi:glycerophosphoryl diester phosphodiesterase